MSTLLRLSAPRLTKALERNGLKDGCISVADLRRTLTKRGMSDRDMHEVFGTLTKQLEPPNCYMSHCSHFGGAGAPMNCGLERVPGKCSILRDFKARKKAKAEKAKAVQVEGSPS